MKKALYPILALIVALSCLVAYCAAVPTVPPPAPVQTQPSSSDATVCTTVGVNLQGSGNASITVDATAGGVTVLAANALRCSAVIQNSGAANMRCAPTTVTVTSSVGYLITNGSTLNLGPESAQAWKCIRTTGSSTTADVAEATQ